jgi:CTP synthase (UTP-ammonia lyase)
VGKPASDLVKIATVADHGPEHPSRVAAIEALAHAADAMGLALEVEWFSTPTLDSASSRASLTGFDGIFAPGGDYENKEGGLAAIRFAREAGWPFFGT